MTLVKELLVKKRWKKDMFRFGNSFIKNSAKAPKKPKTCLRGGKKMEKFGELETLDNET